jgi:hypothetical protein
MGKKLNTKISEVKKKVLDKETKHKLVNFLDELESDYMCTDDFIHPVDKKGKFFTFTNF